jgi:hypothetical protein
MGVVVVPMLMETMLPGKDPRERVPMIKSFCSWSNMALVMFSPLKGSSDDPTGYNGKRNERGRSEERGRGMYGRRKSRFCSWEP